MILTGPALALKDAATWRFVQLPFELFPVYSGFVSPVFQVGPECVAFANIQRAVPGAWVGEANN